MAVGLEPGTTNPSEFEESLSGVQMAEQARAEEMEQQRAAELEEENNKDRQQSRLSSAVGQVARQATKKAVKKVGKKVATRVALAYGWVPALIIIAAIIIISAVVFSINDACKTGWFTSISSDIGYRIGAVPIDVCEAMGFEIRANNNTAAAVPTNAADENLSANAEGDNSAREFLAGLGIPVNKPCINPNGSVADPPGQTCLEGIQGSTLEEVARLQSACNQWALRTNRPRELTPGPNRAEEDSYCEIIVTGGTEQGHATSGTCVHGKGFKIDLSLRPNLNAFIQSQYDEIAPRGRDRRWYNNFTNTSYVREDRPVGSHWDISVGCA